MSLDVKVKTFSNLKGKHDRFAKLIFRGVPFTSMVLPNCGTTANFDQLFNWPLSTPLDEDEFLEVRLYNQNKIFQDRLVGAYRVSISLLIKDGWIEVIDNLLDTSHAVLRCEVRLEMEYKMPQFDEGGLGSRDQLDTVSRMTGRTNMSSSLAGSSKESQDYLQDKEIFHPRIRQPKVVNAKFSDWQVQIRVIEAKELAGMSLDPVVTILIGDLKKNTSVKPQTNNPLWDELFVYDFKLPMNEVMDQILTFQVFTGRSIISQGSLIGDFKMDLWYIYNQPDHCAFSKWAPLLDGENTEIKGHLRLDICMFGKGDFVKDAPQRREDEEIERNLLLPTGIQQYRPVHKYVFKVYKAEGIPQMNATIMANVKKAFTGKVKDLADPFVEVTFCGLKGRTNVIKNSYTPEFNQQITFTEFFPPLCKRVKVQLIDSDTVSESVVGTHFICFDEISNKDTSHGFLPVFGPSWVNLYGSTRDYSTFDEHVDLNNGVGEGISYRGRILLAIDCFEGEPEETGSVEVSETDPLPPKILGREELFLLFGTFYEASMINKKVGDKPIQFEVSIGEYGMQSELVPGLKKGKNGDDDDDLVSIDSDDFQMERISVQSLTYPKRPLSIGKKFYHIPWEEDKPCVHIKFPFEDRRRRQYNNMMLWKIFYTLEENIEELDERVRLGIPNIYRLLRKLLSDIVHGCSLFIELADGKKTATHLAKNRLDKERDRLCMKVVKAVSEASAKLAQGCVDDTDIESKVKRLHRLLRHLKGIISEPQHGLPDVFVWMLCGGRRVAYTRMEAQDLLYSKVDSECGSNCGRVKTIFLRLPGKRGHGEKGWEIQAKVEVRFWLGLLKHKGDYLKDAPSGFDMPEDALSVLEAPPNVLTYTEKQKFVIRTHMYQARSLLGSDESGLSDAFGRVICSNQYQETKVVWETRSPTWDVLLKFQDIVLYGDAVELAVNPPLVVIEVYDKDIGGDVEFIGRALAKPIVKLAEEPYIKPFFPPILQWFPILRGEERAGELLAAFEMLQVSDELFTELPPDPPTVDSPQGPYMPVPDEIRPVMKKHRIEVMFWGIREAKKVQLMKINRPQADIDCCYKITSLEGEEQQFAKSTVCKSAKQNPNFDNPIVVFDVLLPDNKKYIPPITIRVNDCRAFGRHVLGGTHVINSLNDFFCDTSSFRLKGAEEPDTGKKKGAKEQPEQAEVDLLEEAPAETTPVKQKKDKGPSGPEEILDWWTRFYETLRDLETKDVKTKKLIGFSPKKEDEENPTKDVPRLKIYDCPLEDVSEFDAFNDFMRSFNLTRGKKKDDDDDDEMRRFSGKFKGTIKVWKYPLPEGLDPQIPTGSFQRLPLNDPVTLLVRVYCIRALNLHPTDPNGKADPYLVVNLGKKSYKDKDNYVSKQLNPEFGRVFEFEAVLPFDNMLYVQVFDWDMLTSDDMIGETSIDIENRFYSKHRASCGLQENYATTGYAKWRDPQKPTQILAKLCKDEGLDGPTYMNGTCSVENQSFEASPTVKDAKGRDKPSDEPCALACLRSFSELPHAYHLVPEHVETRPLFSSEKPGIEQGKIQMWVDMFPMDLTLPGPAVDIATRKPIDYELRVIIWNTDDVLPDETNIITGESSSDIYVKGWLEGNREDIQETDVHYRSSDGSGMFNWRFVFPFMFHKAEEKIVTKKKASLLSVDLTEEKHPPLLYLQVWDADIFSSDDFIGDLVLKLTKIPGSAKSSRACKLDTIGPNSKTGSIFKSKYMKGWWPFIVNPEDDDDPNPILAGKVEAELELLTKEDAEATPAGKAREEPQPLDKPNRPADSFGLFMSPLKMLKYIFWDSYKWILLKALVVALLLALTGLFLYSMPGYTVKKMFGA